MLVFYVVVNRDPMASCLSREVDSSILLSPPKLHLITYLFPDFPLELFHTYQHYLEEILSCDSYLIVESRWGAPPAGRTDPFTANEVDIGKTYLPPREENARICELSEGGVSRV